MGWVTLALLAVAAAAMLVLLRLPRILWPLGGAALMLGAAGYAWQENATFPAHPAITERPSLDPGDEYRKVRGQLWGQFGGESMYFGISDAALRGGNVDGALRILTGGVDYAPESAAMWTELGTVIALHDNNHVSPAALIAFRRAMALAPEHPGPPFFLGLAYVRAGDEAKSLYYFRRASRLAPADPTYRAPMIDLIKRTATKAQFSAPRPRSPPSSQP